MGTTSTLHLKHCSARLVSNVAADTVIYNAGRFVEELIVEEAKTREVIVADIPPRLHHPINVLKDGISDPGWMYIYMRIEV